MEDFLIWSKDYGFIHIFKGDGMNLLEEDTAAGYVDYIMVDFMKWDGTGIAKCTDGAMVLLKEEYQELFENKYNVVGHLIHAGIISDSIYIILN